MAKVRHRRVVREYEYALVVGTRLGDALFEELERRAMHLLDVQQRDHTELLGGLFHHDHLVVAHILCSKHPHAARDSSIHPHTLTHTH